MIVRITRDSQGWVAWPPETPLDYYEKDGKSQYTDDSCQYRGADNLFDMIDDILEVGDMDDGDILEVEMKVLRITKRNKIK